MANFDSAESNSTRAKKGGKKNFPTKSSLVPLGKMQPQAVDIEETAADVTHEAIKKAML